MNEKKYRWINLCVHAAVWLFFFLWPWLIFHTEMPRFERFYVRYVIFPCMAVLVFYLNYSRWIRRYFFTHRMWLFWLCNILIIAFSISMIHLWQKEITDWLYGPPSHRPPTFKPQWYFVSQNFLNLLMVVVVALVVRLWGRWYKTEIDRQSLAKEKNLAELKNLKSQLHPHFLFNTLNNIYALISIEPEKAKTAVYDLGGLLRYVLKESDREKVPLKDEVAFMNSYIALMRIRLNPETALFVELPTENEAENYQVPPLLYINLIENAFKYGLSARNSFIDIRLGIESAGTRLRFQCRNTVAPHDGRESLLQQDTGVGLSNLRKRLEYIYKTGYRFHTGENQGIYLAELDIPLEKTDTVCVCNA